MSRDCSDHPFDRPVFIQLRLGHDRVIGSVAEAARVLLVDWPERESFGRRYAMLACMRAIRGERSAGHAKRAFVAAAKEIGIYLGEHEAAA